MEFRTGKGMGGPLTKGLIEGWDRVRDGGSYARNRDFFSVHWEVHDHDSQCVRLHVESPRASADPELNAFKARVISALMRRLPAISDIARAHGASVLEGRRLSEQQIQANKSTEPFRIVVGNVEALAPHEEKIAKVDAWAGPQVRNVLYQFEAELASLFPPGG